ncbi:hypothetical protein GCM10023157_30310 [Gluconacetobacter asukensis]
MTGDGSSENRAFHVIPGGMQAHGAPYAPSEHKTGCQEKSRLNSNSYGGQYARIRGDKVSHAKQ